MEGERHRKPTPTHLAHVDWFDSALLLGLVLRGLGALGPPHEAQSRLIVAVGRGHKSIVIVLLLLLGGGNTEEVVILALVGTSERAHM